MGSITFAVRVYSQVNFVTEPRDFIAKGVELGSPGCVSCSLAARFRLLFLIRINRCAVDGNGRSCNDSLFTTLHDEVVKQLFGKAFLDDLSKYATKRCNGWNGSINGKPTLVTKA